MKRTLGFTGPPLLHRSQFEVDEARIVFQLNDARIRTGEDGAFKCVALMDAASCSIFDMAMVPIGKPEPAALEVRRLRKKGWEARRRYPDTLFASAGLFQHFLPADLRVFPR